MKLTNQLVIVICAGIAGMIGLVVGLAVLAKWSDGAIIAMLTAFGAVIVNTIVAVRNQAKTAEVLAGQDDKLDLMHASVATVERRTNGELDQRIAAAMEEAAETGAARALHALREQGVI